MPHALIVALSLALLTGCSVTVNNPNIASKNNVAAKADIKADTKVDASGAQPAQEATLARTSEPRPRYAIADGDAPFLDAELNAMAEMGLFQGFEEPPLSIRTAVAGLNPEQRAVVRSRAVTHDELRALLAGTPIPSPTPSAR